MIGLIGAWFSLAPQSEAEELTVESLPLLEKVTHFSAQGSAFCIVGDYTNRKTDPYRMVVANSVTGQVVRFDSKLWAAPAIFFDERKQFLTATFKDAEGPITYTVNDLDGNMSSQLTTKARIEVSGSGEYFFSVNELSAPARPMTRLISRCSRNLL